MNWAIRDEYFEKVYGKSYKPKNMKNNDTKTTEATTEGELIIPPDKANAYVEINPLGTADRIRLSANLVRQMIATKTRTGKEPDDNQCIKFIMLCKAKHLNPFEGDAFMLGYDTQDGPQWSQITAHQVFLKRAEANQKFNGMESGVIIKLPEGSTLEREGDLVDDDEKLIGGWAKVYRKDREKPFYRRLKLSTFSTGRSRWLKDPAGMICKCAEADSLRTAFPTHLGGLYVEEEVREIDVTPVTPKRLEIKRAKVPELRPGEINTGMTKIGDAAYPTDKPETQQMVLEPEPGGKIRAVATESAPEVVEGETVHEAPPTEKKTAEPPPLRKKGTRSAKKPEPESTGLAPFATEMLGRLKIGNKTPEDLMRIAVENEWCLTDETWPLPEEKLQRFLVEDNWATIVELLGG